LLRPELVKALCKEHENAAQAVLFALWAWEKYWFYQELVNSYEKPKQLFAYTLWEGATWQAGEYTRQWAFEHKRVYNLTNATNVYYNSKKQ